MNLKVQALGGFSKFSDDELLVHTNTVLQAMDGNSNFTTPVPALTVVSDARDAYASALSIARKRSGPEETSAKNDARDELAELMKQLAFYVSSTAKGNLTAVLSSGFHTSALPQQGQVPEQPFGAKLVRGRQSGQLVFSVQKVRGKLYYEYCYGTREDGEVEPQWGDILITTSSRGNVIATVEPLQRYYARIRACNGYGKSEWSDIASCIAL